MDLVALVETVKVGKRSLKDDKSRMRIHLRLAFDGLVLSEIINLRVARFRAGLMQRVESKQLSVGTVRVTLALLKTMLNLAEDANWITRVPKVKLPPSEDKP